MGSRCIVIIFGAPGRPRLATVRAVGRHVVRWLHRGGAVDAVSCLSGEERDGPAQAYLRHGRNADFQDLAGMDRAAGS